MQDKKQNISPIKQRILQFIEDKGLSKREFYAASGISRGTLESNTGITEDTIAKFFATCPEANAMFILTGRDKEKVIYPENDIVRQVQAPLVNEFILQTDLVKPEQRVPIFDLEAAAGLVPLFQETVKHIPINYIQIPNLPKCDGAIYITGDSMYPLLKSGDIVLYKVINDIQNSIFWGEMYLLSVVVDGEEYVLVKYVQKADDPEYVRLVSENRHHSDKEVLLKNIRAMALVKASVRFNSMR